MVNEIGPQPKPGGISRIQHRRLARMLAVMVHPVLQLNVLGHANIPPTGPFVLLPKHRRWEDIPVLALAVSRRLHFIAKTELFNNRVGDALLRFFGGLPLNRRRPMQSRATLSRAAQILHWGQGVVVFPEGTYYPDRVGPGHKGVVRFLVRRTTAPFLPVGIHYPNHSGSKRLGAEVRFGRPIFVDAKISHDAFLELMMERIGVLSGITTKTT